jgi:hypothetical protein
MGLPSSIPVEFHLPQSFRFTMHHLRWFLSIEQKQMGVKMLRELLHVLSTEMADELEFCLPSEHDLMWMAPGRIVPDRTPPTIQSAKFMLSVVWNPSGLHVLKALSKWSKFNSDDCTNAVLVVISDWR